MSKLLDRLEKARRGSPTPMGFATAVQKEQLPALVCLGIVRQLPKKGELSLPPGTVDAFLIVDSGDREAVAKATKALGEAPWGVWTSSLDPEAASSWKEKGCDFLVSGAETTQVATLGEEGVGHFLAVSADLEDRYLRTIEDLPGDGVFLSTDSLSSPLTLQHLIIIGSIRSMFDKYLIVELPADTGQRELEHLRDMGVDGIAVDTTGLSSDTLQQLRQRLVAIGRPRRAKRERPAALLPRSAHAPPRARREEEEEEEEEG